MNRYIFIHRLTGPAILVLLGVVALLSQAHLVHFSIFVPLLLIMLGVLKLVERMALSGWEYPGNGPQGPGAPPYGGQPYPYGAAPYGSSGQPPTTSPTTTSIVPTTHEFGNGRSDTGKGKL